MSILQKTGECQPGSILPDQGKLWQPSAYSTNVIGPVMRGPSSSHTAAPVQIGTLARALLGDEPAAATFNL